jgi:protein-S-isoprenylcysteine O-methyltransferase Ste14
MSPQCLPTRSSVCSSSSPGFLPTSNWLAYVRFREWMRRSGIATFSIYALAAVDLGRLHLSPFPLWVAPIGILLYAAGTALNQWAMIHNPHFEREVRIQTDRAHQVIAAGPYRYVRHPGYLGSLLGFISFPFILGSTLAFIGVIFSITGTLVRTHLEDRTLQEELDGYRAYADAVSHRLLPFIW